MTRALVFFSENFRSNLTFYESKNFSDSSLHHVSESENFRFRFSKKNSVTWVVVGEAPVTPVLCGGIPLTFGGIN